MAVPLPDFDPPAWTDAMAQPGRLTPDASDLGDLAYVRVGMGAGVSYLTGCNGVGCGSYTQAFPGLMADAGVALGGGMRAGVTVVGAVAGEQLAWLGHVHLSGAWAVSPATRLGGFVLAGGVRAFDEPSGIASAGFTLDTGGSMVRFDLALSPVTVTIHGWGIAAVPLVATELGVRGRVGEAGSVRFGMESFMPVISYRHVFGAALFVDVGVATAILYSEVRGVAGARW